MEAPIAIKMNDIYERNGNPFQSQLDDFFKSFSVETRRGGWFRSFDKDLARSCLSVDKSQKPESTVPRTEMEPQ